MVTLRITPDRTIDNRQNYKLIRALYELYVPPLGRFGFGKWFVRYQPQARFWYDVILTADEIRFYVTVPKRWEEYARQKAGRCWPRASLEKVDRDELQLPEKGTQVAEMVYRRHDIFALHVDRTEDTQPLGAVMAAVNDMKDSDLARISICAQPVNRMNWADHAANAHKSFAKGKTPRRQGFSTKRALLRIGEVLDNLFSDASDTFLMVLGHGKDDVKSTEAADYEKREIMLDGHLDRITQAKKTEPVFKTRIRIASHSEDKNRRELTTRALAGAFVEVAGDNELERVDVSSRVKIRILYELNNHRLHPATHLETDTNIMSSSELGKLVQIPGAGLQDEYADQLQTIRLRQTDLPASVRSRGMLIGHQEYKNETIPVYQPTGDEDELCLPHVVIGGMGCGKTKGFGANFAVEAVVNGFGALVIDPAKKEMGDEIVKALEPGQVIRIDLSKQPISLDWCEVKYSSRAKNRLANTMITFFNTATDDAGPQTERYLRAAVMAMQTGKLSEIMRIFEDEVYRKKIVKKLPDGLNKMTLESFGKESESRQRQILAPIYNRMNTILGDEYLAQCMESDDSIDMVQLLSQRKAVVIDIPAKDIDGLAIDLMVNMLSTKIDLAMRLREEDNQFPYFVIFDEPHQYLRSATLWRAASVESRKWRLGYVWMFHSWEQIPRDLAEIIKAAGPHYHLYTSSQKTYRDLSFEISPFSIEEALATPRFHAINIIRAGGISVSPFMAKMLAPPTIRARAG